MNKNTKVRKKNQRKTREEINDEGLERKRLRKHKGRPSGSRTDVTQNNKNMSSGMIKKDPKIGSKKPIPLIVQDKKTEEPSKKSTTILPVTPQYELEQLESDPYLDTLLERLENEEVLSLQEQTYVDDKLDRINELLEILGLDGEGDDDEGEKDPEPRENIMDFLKRT